MSIPIRTGEDFHQYLRLAMHRALDHSPIAGQLLTVAAAVWWAMDEDQTPLIREQESEMKNSAWVAISGSRYYFGYDHTELCIRIRRGTNRGEVVLLVTETTPAAEIVSFFTTLKPELLPAHLR